MRVSRECGRRDSRRGPLSVCRGLVTSSGSSELALEAAGVRLSPLARLLDSLAAEYELEAHPMATPAQSAAQVRCGQEHGSSLQVPTARLQASSPSVLKTQKVRGWK